ncbi:DUF3102 domain-containing protein [Chlorogloea sp. CCALA 695]|uniref:DUF3102 domain-containing protein n=1 Tax=Chlorogloea sp. CCALA 695 TaxID=2107693 RepID=UPI000D0707AE|nr:DUF3102 domain-containing protein [Chlorogloea sp. CCALA 695]PSB25036.1 hypothetical protein C7B70_25165 [Chlorogloea sp. CCALA 695]
MSFSKLSDELSEYNYTMLEPEIKIVVQQRTSEIKSLIHRSAQDIFDIGQKLIEVKEKLGHGRFVMWLNTEFNWSKSAAQRFMQVARQFKRGNFTDLKIASSALYLLASSNTSIAARQEALQRATQGEIINYSAAKSIIAQHKKIGKRSLLPEQMTVDVPAETVNEVLLPHIQQKLEYTEPLDGEISFEQLRERAKQLGLLPTQLNERCPEGNPLNAMPVEAIKTCTNFINTVEDMNSQILGAMEDEALKVLINKSNLLAKRAKMLLTQRWQLGIQK